MLADVAYFRRRMLFCNSILREKRVRRKPDPDTPEKQTEIDSKQMNRETSIAGTE